MSISSDTTFVFQGSLQYYENKGCDVDVLTLSHYMQLQDGNMYEFGRYIVFNFP